MSYILEALRRADAERQRGAVPGLHDQEAGPLTRVGEPTARLGSLALAGAAVLVVIAAAAGAWWWAVGQPAAPVLRAAAAVPAAAAATASVTASPSASATATAAVAPASVVPAPASDVPTRPAAEVQALRPTALPLPPVAMLASGQRPAAARDLPPARTASTVDTPPARLPALADMPDAVRREMATLSFGGSVHAEQPAARMVILNGQVFHEGDSPSAELRIEQIRPRSVVFILRGQRFEMPM